MVIPNGAEVGSNRDGGRRVSAPDSPTANQRDFDRDLEKLEREIGELGPHVLVAPIDFETATRYVARLYQRASLTGSWPDLDLASAAIDKAIARIGDAPDLYYLKANVQLKCHRLTAVKESLAASSVLGASPQGRVLLADVRFQEGRYDDARQGYESALAEDRTWDNLARLAHFEAKVGDPAGADTLYEEAEDELTAKEMRAYAWVELQRGLLDLTHGRHEDALAHYRTADRAYSGYWLVEEHMAEVLAVLGRFGHAVALYERVVARVPRPELQQALGELYACMGRADLAEPWYDRALAGYLHSVERGEVHYYHHLVDFYADVRQDGPHALVWARRDVALRDNYSTRAALAWALYRNGQVRDALDTMRAVLASGTRDGHLFACAARIFSAAGATDDGNRYAEMAAAINPHHRLFHVHR